MCLKKTSSAVFLEFFAQPGGEFLAGDWQLFTYFAADIIVASTLDYITYLGCSVSQNVHTAKTDFCG
jgi:hypothetical protein